MREREGKHLAKDLIHRLKVDAQMLKEIRALHPDVVKKYRTALLSELKRPVCRSTTMTNAAKEISFSPIAPIFRKN